MDSVFVVLKTNILFTVGFILTFFFFPFSLFSQAVKEINIEESGITPFLKQYPDSFSEDVQRNTILFCFNDSVGSFWYKIFVHTDCKIYFDIFPSRSASIYNYILYNRGADTSFRIAELNAAQPVRWNFYRDEMFVKGIGLSPSANKDYTIPSDSIKYYYHTSYHDAVEVKNGDILFLNIFPVKGKDCGHYLTINANNHSKRFQCIFESCYAEKLKFSKLSHYFYNSHAKEKKSVKPEENDFTLSRVRARRALFKKDSLDFSCIQPKNHVLLCSGILFDTLALFRSTNGRILQRYKSGDKNPVSVSGSGMQIAAQDMDSLKNIFTAYNKEKYAPVSKKQIGSFLPDSMKNTASLKSDSIVLSAIGRKMSVIQKDSLKDVYVLTEANRYAASRLSRIKSITDSSSHKVDITTGRIIPFAVSEVKAHFIVKDSLMNKPIEAEITYTRSKNSDSLIVAKDKSRFEIALRRNTKYHFVFSSIGYKNQEIYFATNDNLSSFSKDVHLTPCKPGENFVMDRIFFILTPMT